MNYCLSDDDSNVAVLPLGLTAMINHNFTPNVVLKWYDWDNDNYFDGNDDLYKSSEEFSHILKRKPPIVMDFDIAYLATRDIMFGEEIYINYGVKWQRQWKQSPSERAFIAAPRNFYPPSWYNSNLSTCEFYLAKSNLQESGRGIFTGKDLYENDVVEVSPVIYVRDSATGDWTLSDYVYQSKFDEFSEAPLGMAMIYNHQSFALRQLAHKDVNADWSPTTPWNVQKEFQYSVVKKNKIANFCA
jgi:hypothetical protein